MDETSSDYTALPRLRAELARLRAAGRTSDTEFESLERSIAALAAQAKRDAALAVGERDRAKERFQSLALRIRELQGSTAEIPGGPEARQAKIRELSAAAQQAKDHHQELTARLRDFKWYLTGVEDRTPGDEGTVESDTAVTASTRKRRWWLAPVIVGGALLVLAVGAYIALSFLDSRLQAQLEAVVTDLLAEYDPNGVVGYDELTVSSLRGEATFSGVAVQDPESDGSILADRITVRVPRLEAFRSRGALRSRDPEQVHFSSISVAAEGILAVMPDGNQVQGESLVVELEGDLQPGLLSMPPEDQVRAVDRAELTVNDVALVGEDELFAGLRDLGWAGDTGDLTHLTQLHAELHNDVGAGEISLADFLLETPLATQSGRVRVAYAGTLGEADAWIRELEFELSTSTDSIPGAFAIPVSDSDELTLVDLPEIDLTVSGSTAFADESLEFQPSLTSGEIALEVGPGAVTLPPSTVTQLSMSFAGEMADELLVDGTVSMSRLALNARLSRGGMIDLEELVLDSSLAALTLTGRAALNEEQTVEPGSLALSGSVERLPNALRAAFTEFAAMLGATIPAAGAFEFTLELNELGEPRLRVQ